jgi:hypothetical protein
MPTAPRDPIRDLADRALRESLCYPEHLRGRFQGHLYKGGQSVKENKAN